MKADVRAPYEWDRLALAEEHPESVNFSWFTPAQQIAVLARVLHREGQSERATGHITFRDDDDTLLTNPYPLEWDEVRASDIVRIDMATGERLEGKWRPTPAIPLHLALHQARHDVRFAVHCHPTWGSVWAAIGEVPPIYDQTASLLRGEIVLFDQYEERVSDLGAAERNVAALQGSSAALLANHGVLVVAPVVELAHLRCAALEHRCRLAWHVAATGREGKVMAPAAADRLARAVDQPVETREAWPYAWEGAVRRELRHDRSVLD